VISYHLQVVIRSDHLLGRDIDYCGIVILIEFTSSCKQSANSRITVYIPTAVE